MSFPECSPLSEKFLIFGLKSEQIGSHWGDISPEILDSHPGKPSDFERRCVHNITLALEKFRVEEANETSVTIQFYFHFFILNIEGRRRYATVLVFTESSNKDLDTLGEMDSIILTYPKGFVMLSSTPCFEVQKNILIYLHECHRLSDSINFWQVLSLSSSLIFDQSRNYEGYLECPNGHHIRYRSYKSKFLILPNYRFDLLLRILSPEKMLFLVWALLLGHNVIVQYSNCQQNAIIIEALTSLLYPFKVPYVASSLDIKSIEKLSRTQFCVGIRQKFGSSKSDPVSKQPLWGEYKKAIVFNVDTGKVENESYRKLPPVPAHFDTIIIKNLTRLLERKDGFVTEIPVSKEQMAEYYWAYVTLKTKQQFFNFILISFFISMNYDKSKPVISNPSFLTNIFTTSHYRDFASQESKEKNYFCKNIEFLKSLNTNNVEILIDNIGKKQSQKILTILRTSFLTTSIQLRENKQKKLPRPKSSLAYSAMEYLKSRMHSRVRSSNPFLHQCFSHPFRHSSPNSSFLRRSRQNGHERLKSCNNITPANLRIRVNSESSKERSVSVFSATDQQLLQTLNKRIFK